MTPCLAVTVQQLASSRFSWKLMQRQDSGAVECVAESSDSLPDYEQALEAGFVALHSFNAVGTGLTQP